MSKKQQKQQKRIEAEQQQQLLNQPMVSDSNRKMILYQMLAVFFFAFALYANTISNEYAVDDTIVITKNKLTQQGFAGIPKIMTTDAFYGFFGEDYKFVEGGRYRPLSIVTFAIEQQFFHGNPHISHFINILMYAFLCLLVFLVLLELFKSPKLIPYGLTLPFVAALIFAAHPIHTEVVANIKGRDEIMGMLGSILTLYWMLLYVRTQNLTYLAGALVAFMAALLSKENSITFLAVIPLTLYFFTNAKLKDYAVAVAPALVLAVVYVSMRHQFTPVEINILESGKTHSREILNNPFLDIKTGENISADLKLATIAFTFFEYIKLLIIPHPLTYDYYYNQVPIVGFDNPIVWLSVLINGALLVYAVMGIMKKNPIAYAILYYYVTISIVSNLLFTVGIAMNERFVFMSSFGVAILFGIGIIAALNYAKEKNWDYRTVLNPTTTWMVLGTILLLYSVKTFTRNMDWKNDYVLFKADVVNSPNSAKVANAYGGELVAKGDATKDTTEAKKYYREANQQLTRALQIYPNYLNAWLLKGNALYKLTHNMDSAMYYYGGTLRLKPGYYEGSFNLGTVLLEEAQKQLNENNPAFAYKYAKEAIPYLKIAMVSKPDRIEPEYNLADAYAKGGSPDSSIMTYFDLAKKQPNNALPIYKIGAVYGRIVGNLDSSIVYLTKAIEMDPKQDLYVEDLGVAYGMKKDYANLLKTYEAAIQRNPKYAPYYFNIGVTYREMGNPAKADEYFKKANEFDAKRYPYPPPAPPAK